MMSNGAVFRGVVAPLGILLLAFFVLFFAGMNGSLGPLDLATADWIVVALWVIAPVVGGSLGHGLNDRELHRAATLLGAGLGAAVAFVFVTAAGTASTSCTIGGVGSSAAGYVVGCLAVGAIAGTGMGASLLVAARLTQRGQWLSAMALGSALNLAAGAGAYCLFYSIITCLR